MSVCSVFAETEKTESTSCLFSFFFPKPQSFVVFVSVLICVTKINKSIFSVFCTDLKKTELVSPAIRSTSVS